MTSERQRNANRANAQRSTGPRTPAGKERSSINATTHGCYTSRSYAIPRGALAEDPEQVGAFVDDIVRNLAPRDTLEYCAADMVANLMVKVRRLGLFEAEAIAGVAPNRTSAATMAVDPLIKDEDNVLRERGAIAAIEEVLINTARIDRDLSSRLKEALARYQDLQMRDIGSNHPTKGAGSTDDETNPIPDGNHV